jgi:hypothetical protein
MATSKCVDLSLADQVKIVNELKLPGITQVQVVKKFGVSTSQLSRIIKVKDDTIRDFEVGGSQTRKRQRASKENDVGDALFLWFQQKITQGAPLSGPLLKQKATELALTKGTDFTPSDGWLSRWKVIKTQYCL